MATQQEPVQERLKEQVGVSVKEALEKTTGILSNLHRVQSYLYVVNTVSSAPGTQGLRNALQQVRGTVVTVKYTVCKWNLLIVDTEYQQRLLADRLSISLVIDIRLNTYL